MRDLKHRRPVALKVLNPALAVSLGADRFLREIELAARLQHPHIITVFDSGDAAGTLWFTMPYVEGESLRDRLRRERQLPLADALRIATEAARALDFAHELYLKGRFAWNQRTVAGLNEAVNFLEQAVVRDSTFAPAWAALASAYLLVVPYAGASREVTWPKGRAAAGKALALTAPWERRTPRWPMVR